MVKSRKIIIVEESTKIQEHNTNFYPTIKILQDIMPHKIQNKKYLTYTDLVNDKKNIKILDMSKKDMTSLSNNFLDLVCKLNDVVELRLNDNYLNILQIELFSCTNINKLDLSNNLLCESSTEHIYKLINLRELNLANCGDYSSNICYLTNLSTLNLSNNYSGCHNHKLKKYLNLQSGSEISLGVYGQIGEKLLNLNPVKDTIVPKFINNLFNLTHLTIDSCKLKSIPNEILSMINLTYLSLNNNKISAIPEKLLLLNKLTHLFLSDNDIKVIPEKINLLENLTHLSMDNNYITGVPEKNIKSLKNLKMFGIALNPLTKMSSLLWDINGICELDLRKIKNIPAKNNDLDMSIIINSKTTIPDKISTVKIFFSLKNKNLSDEILDNIPSFVDNLIIICNGPIKLSNLPPSLKSLSFVDYEYTQFKWIKEYIEKQYIKLPFGCEISQKVDYKYKKLCN